MDTLNELWIGFLLNLCTENQDFQLFNIGWLPGQVGAGTDSVTAAAEMEHWNNKR